ncbi:uncharacterized protein PV09_01541 [Verruconis gallopava]|uniref:Heterokaryon incompatibility domain-containing protein n=1 Tax=Verruconis gallopava TaxID=253628 RepID=A0A0D2B8M1_9PEZI|nr:uncharacterized protein PV09_01541 [Verruconis gallopava]KIW07589.1 hypothetical protein PV09_01541 [Verruconis gallopava]
MNVSGQVRHGSDMYKAYQYSTLDPPTTLRLIKLWPAMDHNATLQCNIVELREPYESEDYDALSWCWGSQDKKEWSKELIIHVNDDQTIVPKVFYISENLDGALRAFRRKKDKITLWIDAISINQDNLDEKSYQIPLMAVIYPKAKRVHVWLGPEDFHSTLALEFIKNSVLKLWNFDKLCQTDDENNKSKEWEAFSKLLNRDWFGRRWVVQEISLATEAIVHCGSKHITWQEFSDAVSLFVEAENKSRLSEVMRNSKDHSRYQDYFGEIPASAASLLVDTTRNLFRRSNDGGREPISSLEYLVCSLSIFKASNERDSIYALLAIAKDALPQAGVTKNIDEGLNDLESPEVRRQIRAWARIRGRKFAVHAYHVDYKQEIVDVYKDFVLFAIRKAEKSRALDIICRPWAQEVSDEDGGSDKMPLPSWICTLRNAPYDVSQRPNLGERMARKNADPLVGMPDIAGRNYTAAGSKSITASEFKFKKGDGYYSMFVQGFVLDEITRGESNVGTSDSGSIPRTWRSFMHSGTQNRVEEDFWRTLVADRGPDGKSPPAYYRRACEEVFKTGHKDGPIQTNELIYESGCTIVEKFLRRVQAVVWNRRLMKTKHLGKIGLFPAETRTGDYVCILYGCSVPVVLRKVEKDEEEIEADIKLALREQVAAAVMIQRRFRESRTIRLARARRRKAIAKALVWKLVKPYIYGSKALDLACSIGFVVCVSLCMSLDPLAWLRTVLSSIRIGFLQAFALLTAQEEDRRLSSIVVLSLAFGPLISVTCKRIWRSGRTIARSFRLFSNENIRMPKPNPEYFVLIGECYLHGMMNGEAITEQRRAQSKSTVASTSNGHAVGQNPAFEEPIAARAKSKKAQKAANRKLRARRKKEEELRGIHPSSTLERFQNMTFEIR